MTGHVPVPRGFYRIKKVIVRLSAIQVITYPRDDLLYIALAGDTRPIRLQFANIDEAIAEYNELCGALNNAD